MKQAMEEGKMRDPDRDVKEQGDRMGMRSPPSGS